MNGVRSGRKQLLPRLLVSAAASAVGLYAVSALAVTAAAPVAHPPSLPARTPIYSARAGLAPGWQDLGWAPHILARGAPASLDLSGESGWILTHPQLAGTYASFTFRLRAPAAFNEFLEVGLDSTGATPFPRIRLSAERGRRSSDGYLIFHLSMRELNPRAAPFDRVVFRAFRDVPGEPVLLDDIALLEDDAQASAAATGRPVEMIIDCAAKTRTISPLIYGTAGQSAEGVEMGGTARRWGGNPTTRYNWELGHAWNTARDWFFRNVNVETSSDTWLEENLKQGVRSALTLPTIGWVAKDTTSYSFPVSVLGPQMAGAPENPDMGNGVGLDGNLLPPLSPTRTSVRAPPEFIARWVKTIRQRDEKSRTRSVHQYILDNEPTLWDSTQRDVHPAPVSFDELLEMTISYGTAVREADPGATIAGPAAWGWLALFNSGLDMKRAVTLNLDRIAHGNAPLVQWWLRKVREHEKRTGVRLIDLLDVHFYPQARGMGIFEEGGVDSETAALRIRSTRSLWDPTYLDESWINDKMRLIPRLQEWIDEYAPGVGISIGEYNFGAEQHMSGGLAVAEALGRFGQFGVTSAFYWLQPAKGTPAYWAFHAYRNFDGKGGRFLEISLKTRTTDKLSSIFASRDAAGGHLIAILLNFDPTAAADVRLALPGCGHLKTERAFAFAGALSGFQPARFELEGERMVGRLPPYSMTVVDLKLEQR